MTSVENEANLETYNLETKYRYFNYLVFSEMGFILDREVLLSFNTTSKTGGVHEKNAGPNIGRLEPGLCYFPAV